MNMMYSDHYNVRFDTSTYIELSKDFIKDKDVKDYKILNYYLHVVLNEYGDFASTYLMIGEYYGCFRK